MLILALACTQPPAAIAAVDDLIWAPSASEAAPMSLTAADGTGLKLAQMHVQAVVEAPLAYTELHLVFDNPSDRQIEGRFEITLPVGAAVSRFAMKLGSKWQEGEVVELQAARRAYEDFLHRRTDPALLEYEAGNEFRARVFPIEPHAQKELIIAWSHDLDVNEGWTLPTGGLPELGQLTAEVTSQGKTYSMRTEYAVPEGDLALPAQNIERLGLRGPNTSVVRVVPKLDVANDPVKNAVVLIDTSASRALSFEALLADVAAIVPTFDGKVDVFAFDQDVVPLWSGKAREFGKPALEALRKRGPLGASDLAGALKQAEQAERVILFTDGVITAGEKDTAALRKVLKATKIQRMDAVIRGGARDGAALAELVSSLPRDGVVLDADALSSADVGRRLGLGTAGVVELSVPGAAWIWPTQAAGLQPGDSLTVYAYLPQAQPLDLLLDGRSVGPIPTKKSDGPLLKRASAQAQIQSLQYREGRATDPRAREELTASIVEVSTKNRVLSPHTALLVLETEEDYARFGIPRDALTDILVIEKGQLSWLKRGTPVFGKPPEEDRELPKNENRDAAPDADEKAKESKKEVRDGDGDRERSMDSVDAAPAPPPAEPPAARAPARPSPRGRMEREESRRSMSTSSSAGEAMADESEAPEAQPVSQDPLAAWEGDYRTVMEHVLAERFTEAERFALAWRARSPGDPLALLALGEIWSAQGRTADAARAYGALIDLFPSRADLRRLAGERLEALGAPGLSLAVDTYRTAVAQRPDHPSGHRLLAWALTKQGDHAGAIAAITAAMEQPFERFEAAHRILKEDAALIAAAWKRANPNAPVSAALKPLGVQPATTPGLRFVLNWETDANDVDFHIYDGKGGHAFYSSRTLPSGGDLYADITTGYGPECFAIDKASAYPYRMQAHYYSRGPMGFGMGKLQVIEHDGKGQLHFDERPFVVMTDGAFVPLGDVAKSAF